ncbi:hypothetical protein Lal_00030176 [Lupinus albus]|nr:hypothetical protein Lal_00030176 [Lupinus albus]
MASSSKRPHSSKSKQGESTSKSNPLNLTRLLANDAQRKENLMTSHVKGNDIVLDMKTFSSICCDIPMTGDITGLVCVSLDGETKVALNLCEVKHRTDRQPAPADEPEPTPEPNQPESHAQSSSSAAMSTNQKIMDELVSLRGYITTNMDAFDTQSQQIHYELYRLSSRLSNMDVDEDSSEPES